jgi:hypothetical protein
MHNGDYYASLYKHIDMFKDRLPLSTFPIATDPFGNLFIMSLHPDGHGHIYFWDREGEPEYQNGHYTDNCTFVAYSFSDFLTICDKRIKAPGEDGVVSKYLVFVNKYISN